MASQLCKTGGASQSKLCNHMGEAPAYSSQTSPFHTVKGQCAYLATQTTGGLQDGRVPPPSARAGVIPHADNNSRANKKRMMRFMYFPPFIGEPFIREPCLRGKTLCSDSIGSNQARFDICIATFLFLCTGYPSAEQLQDLGHPLPSFSCFL